MKVLAFISKGLAPLTILGVLIAFLCPPIFLALREWFLWFFATTMFALGLVLEPSQFRSELADPKKLALGLATQFTVMPVLGLAAALLSGFHPELALGFIIVGCAPGAMASNVIVYLSGGATAYSVALTTVATLLSPVVTPLLVELLGGVFVPIPFGPMMQTILLTVLAPLVAGLVGGRVLGGAARIARAVAPAVAVLSIVVIVGVGVATNVDQMKSAALSVFGLVILVNLLGYCAGWYAARLFHFERAHQVALAVEIGMQNAGLGVALALKHFSPATALPGVLFAVWCILTAAGATSLLNRKRPTVRRMTDPDVEEAG